MFRISRIRISLILAFLVIIGFAITSWLSYRVAHDSLAEQVYNDSLPLTSSNIYSEIQSDLFRPILISSLMAQSSFVRNWQVSGEKNPKQIVQYLQEIKEEYNTITSYFISDTTKQYYHPDGLVKKISESNPDDDWYFRAKSLPQDIGYEINIDRDASDPDRLVIFVNYQVYDFDNNFIGITGVGLGLDLVKEMIETYQQRYSSTVYFVDDKGQIALHGNSFHGFNFIEHLELDTSTPEALSKSLVKVIEYRKDNKTFYLNTRWVDQLNWYLVVEQEVESSDEKLVTTLKTNLLLSFLVSGLILLIAHLAFSKYQHKLETMAVTDKLSGGLNRQAFDLAFAEATNKASKLSKPLSLIMLDIDNFKQFNDQLGHLVGDRVIEEVAKICKSCLTESDFLCRWGGEEFIILLQDKDLETASKLAETIRSKISSSEFDLWLTASFGVTEYVSSESLDKCVQRADEALYRAKEFGKNCVKQA